MDELNFIPTVEAANARITYLACAYSSRSSAELFQLIRGRFIELMNFYGVNGLVF